ncbi:hypothetical protein N0V83_003243 [Neocucurbitaria cava]|uniref:Major facilitator superfamily (MFS) profile domain-containing protein n=1 Tax=Neocucurbitaria cava TaxID=798079 RepID=A0A9W8YBI8_9PLEO|nr:hypothetical protein N0V83_003243 [Neocucurbitaria cava]
MGGLLTVPLFLERFPQVDIINDPSFHNAWVTGNGFTTSTAPAYQAECVKSHRKGTILMISAGAFVSFGLALSYWLVFGFAYISNSSAAWRVPIAFQIVFALPAIAMLLILPESPRWLILTGREQEALTVLAALNDSEVEDFETRDEFLQIKDAILIMAQGSTASMFSNKERRSFHRVVLAYFVQVFQQITGINLVLQYLSWILLTRMSYIGWLARLLASCSATAYFLASFIVVVGIDRFWGRRSLMLFGAAGMSGCMVLLSVLQYLWLEVGSEAARIASTVFLFGFSVFFAIGWQGMAWLYQVEIVPLRIRGPANGLSTSANWMLNFIIVFITPIAFQRISYRTWIILAATNFAIIPLVYFFYPETAFRSLEEVDVIFQLANDAPGNPWLNAVKISKSEPLWFGQRGEKGFNYANSSWHKRDSNPDNQNSPPRPSSESPIDPRLYASPPLTPMTTVTTTIRSDTDKRPKKLSKKSSSIRAMQDSISSDRAFVGAGVPNGTPAAPTHHRSRSNSEGSIHSVRPEWWTEDLAPAPLSIRSRTSSQTRAYSRPNTSDAQQQSFFTDNSNHDHSANGGFALETEESADPVHPDTSRYHARSVNHREDAWSVTDNDYPGRLGEGIVRTSSARETYLPDGLPDSNRERARPTSQGSGSRRFSARGAGRAY